MPGVAIKRYERASARKVNRLLGLIRGQNVIKARNALIFLSSRTKIPVLKVLNSAVANLKNKEGKLKIEDKDLFVKSAVVDGATMLKRWKAGPFGMPHIIRRRTCHITITVDRTRRSMEPKGAAAKKGA